MKKRYLAGFALLLGLCGAPMTTTAQSNTDTEIYDFSGLNDVNILNAFYKAWQDGQRRYPTMAEFEAAGIQPQDLEFVRSHVRRAEIMSRADRLVTGTHETRNLFMNIPMDIGKDGGVGHPEGKFHADVYSMWQYTNIFGSWNHGVFSAPGAWVDAAHRNGTDIMSGIKFFESWTGGGDAEYSNFITQKDANGKFKWVEPLINCLMYFGSDGINYNWEDNSFGNADIVDFHKELWKYAAEVGFDNYHSMIYTSNSGLTAGNVDALFGSSTGKTHDTMLNYASGAFSYQMAASVTAAKNAMGTADGLYAGVWIASMTNRGWSRLNSAKECGICLWGEHGQSRFMSYNSGDGAFDTQGNYQRLLERGFSGGNRNPANRPAITENNLEWEKSAAGEALYNFAGLASWIPERSTIQGDLHFRTHFTLGNGDRYFFKGKNAYANNWYNMSAQDIVPTYRWLLYKSNTTTVNKEIEVNYTHLDAYTGGSCIELTGAATSTGTDIVLYKTSLKAGSDAYARLAVKTLRNVKASNLYLILKKAGSDTWLEYPYGDIAGNNWEEKKINLTNIAKGDVIERIGLRVKGNNADYQLYVGLLEVNDATTIKPANIKSLKAEVKKESKSSMAIKLYWDVNAVAKTRNAWNLVYNDEANISHFEMLYKNGENGKVVFTGTTSQWAGLIPNIDFESVNDEPYVGVRAVSTDLKTYSPIVWVKVPRAAQSTLPEKAMSLGNYGVSEIDPEAEGLDRAQKLRYLTEVTTTGATQNLNYKSNTVVPEDDLQHVDALDHVLTVRQGQTVTIKLKAFDSTYGPVYADDGNPDGLRWCFAGGWIDLNGSGDFDRPLPVERTASEIENGKTETDPEGERIFFAGTVRAGNPEIEKTGSTYTFKIPENATPGDSRLRIVFADAWFAGTFNPVGYLAKGYSIDFSVKIEGTNPGRVIVDNRDKGEADEPADMENANTAVEEVESEVSTAEGAEGAIIFNNVEKAWVYTVDGKFVKFANNKPATVEAEPGIYLVKMQNGNVMRSAKIMVK